MKLTETEKKILNMVQEDFPVTKRPYKKLADIFGLTEEKMLDIFKKLKKSALVMRVTPSFGLDKIKYKSILVSAKIPKNKIKNAGDFINKYPEVTHNYIRSHEYNLWFTITSPLIKRIKEIIKEIEIKFKVKVLKFPKIKAYKLKMHLKF